MRKPRMQRRTLQRMTSVFRKPITQTMIISREQREPVSFRTAMKEYLLDFLQNSFAQLVEQCYEEIY